MNVVQFKKGETMIKLTYKQLNSAEFNQAIMSLSQQNGFANFQAAYQMSKISRKVQEELKIARELFLKKAEDFIAKDEKGEKKIATKPHPTLGYELQEGKEKAYEDMLADFIKTEVVIQAKPLPITALGTVKLSPTQMIALEPILDASGFEESQGPSQH